MFDHWRAKFEAGEPLHQVFVTVSATLKDQVGRHRHLLLIFVQASGQFLCTACSKYILQQFLCSVTCRALAKRPTWLPASLRRSPRHLCACATGCRR
jgi:hypothetical protein